MGKKGRFRRGEGLGKTAEVDRREKGKRKVHWHSTVDVVPVTVCSMATYVQETMMSPTETATQQQPLQPNTMSWEGNERRQQASASSAVDMSPLSEQEKARLNQLSCLLYTSDAADE